MNQFETIKAAVPLRQAAETYGLRVLRNGMTCCPFHEDRHPSMKLNKDYFFCFGCGASGDVIDFTARLFGLSPYAAAQKLETDFRIDAETKPLPFPNHAEPSRDRERLCICVLRDYLRHLRIWQLRYRPEKPGDPIHPLCEEALKRIPEVNYYLDCLHDKAQSAETARMLCDDGHIQRLSEYLAALSEKERDCA